MSRPARPVRWLPVTLLALSLGAVAVVLVTDLLAGGALARWAAEYEGGGSCAWRGERGAAFQLVLLALGLPAYPLSLAAAVLWARESRRAPTPGARRSALALAVVAAALLVVLIGKGVASAALEWC